MTNEQIDFLKEFQKTLQYENEHDYDSQASPRFWVVGDYRFSPVPEGFEDTTYINLPNRDYGGDIDQLIKLIKEDELEDLDQDAIDDLDSIECEESALDWFKEYYDDEAYLVPVRKEHFIQPNTFFLTKEEAKRHIRLNNYHYSSEAHTYAMTAWRSPKVEKLLDILTNVNWDDIKMKTSKRKY